MGSSRGISQTNRQAGRSCPMLCVVGGMVGDTNNGEWELGGWDEVQPAMRGGERVEGGSGWETAGRGGRV